MAAGKALIDLPESKQNGNTEEREERVTVGTRGAANVWFQSASKPIGVGDQLVIGPVAAEV